MTRRSQDQRASMLTEVLISLALLVPVVVIVAGLFPYSFTVDRKAWSQRTAQSLARSALEEARGQKFDSVVSFSQTVTKDNTPYQVQVVVTQVDPPEVREKLLHCTVSWPRQNGIDSLILESRLAKIYQDPED